MARASLSMHLAFGFCMCSHGKCGQCGPSGRCGLRGCTSTLEEIPHTECLFCKGTKVERTKLNSFPVTKHSLSNFRLQLLTHSLDLSIVENKSIGTSTATYHQFSMNPPQGALPPLKDLTIQNITENVNLINSNCSNPRLKYILERLVSHLHEFARETRLSTKEWMAGIEFLTAVGQICTDVRQVSFLWHHFIDSSQ